MAAEGKEIIDLTGEPEIIVLDSDPEDKASAPSLHKSNGSTLSLGPQQERTAVDNSQSVIDSDDNTPEAGPSSHGKEGRKKLRKKKRRKQVVVLDADGGEDGELMELDTTGGSVQVSREQSRERITPSSKNANQETQTKGKERAEVPSDGALYIDDGFEGVASDSDYDTQRAANNSKQARKQEKKRKRRENVQKREKESSSHARSPSPPLFFVDDKPTEVPTNAKPVALPPPSVPSETKVLEEALALLLPAHVTVMEDTGDNPVEIIQPPPVDSDDDYIEYLDYDDDRRLGVVRYFDDPAEMADAKAAKATRTVCKNCGAEGEHKTRECPVIICLTCGARDEHSTRSCPISKTCFTCGMKGHINRDCPNRYKRRNLDNYQDCDRCGSMVHSTNECPTLWRMYEYVDDTERKVILTIREQKCDLPLGEGGEGYIAPEEWCYNCGGCGHLGDDCREVPHPHDKPREASAFSKYNTMSGPFYDAEHPLKRAPSKAATYARQARDAWGDGYGGVLPLDVGKQGKKKERARMEKRALQVQEDDGDDWFANRGASNQSRGGGSSGGGSDKKGSLLSRLSDTKKISFGKLGKDSGRHGEDSRENGRRHRDRDRDRDRGRDRGRDDRGHARHEDPPLPMRETERLQIRGAARREEDWDGSIRGAASRNGRGRDHNQGSNSRDAYDQNRKERSRHSRRSPERRRDRDERGASPRREPRYRGGYNR